jgi:ABC-type branched-subunit amino acid transport system permease subunit
MDLLIRGPITEDTAPIHVQRAWYVALGSATVMLLGAIFSLSFNLLMGAIIVVGLGHGMNQRSWVASGALLLYLVSLLAQAGWRQGQPILIALALAVAYFLAQGFRATWWWREHEQEPRITVA